MVNQLGVRTGVPTRSSHRKNLPEMSYTRILMPFSIIRAFMPLLLLALSSCSRTEHSEAPAQTAPESRISIQVFYKAMPPSLQTHEQVKSFLDALQGRHEVIYLLMTDPDNEKLMQQLGLPTEHFPFGMAINGKTSASIDGETIVFANFPDFMHHIGRHQGNWTLSHLERVLENPEFLLADNPRLESRPGGGQRAEGQQEDQL